MTALELLDPVRVLCGDSADRLMIGAAAVAPVPQYISRIPVTSFLLAGQPENPVPVLIYGSLAGAFLPHCAVRFARRLGPAMAAVLVAGVAHVRALARPIAFERILAAILGVPLAVVEFITSAVRTPRHVWGEFGGVQARVLVLVSVIVVARVDRTARKRPIFSTVALAGANGPFGCGDAAVVAPSPLGAFAAVLGALVRPVALELPVRVFLPLVRSDPGTATLAVSLWYPAVVAEHLFPVGCTAVVIVGVVSSPALGIAFVVRVVGIILASGVDVSLDGIRAVLRITNRPAFAADAVCAIVLAWAEGLTTSRCAFAAERFVGVLVVAMIGILVGSFISALVRTRVPHARTVVVHAIELVDERGAVDPRRVDVRTFSTVTLVVAAVAAVRFLGLAVATNLGRANLSLLKVS